MELLSGITVQLWTFSVSLTESYHKSQKKISLAYNFIFWNAILVIIERIRLKVHKVKRRFPIGGSFPIWKELKKNFFLTQSNIISTGWDWSGGYWWTSIPLKSFKKYSDRIVSWKFHKNNPLSNKSSGLSGIELSLLVTALSSTSSMSKRHGICTPTKDTWKLLKNSPIFRLPIIPKSNKLCFKFYKNRKSWPHISRTKLKK